MMVEDTEQKIEQRITRVETEVQNLTHQVGRVVESVDKLSRFVNQSSVTPWGTLASWAAVILSIVFFVGYGYVRQMDTLEGGLAKQQDQYVEVLKDIAVLKDRGERGCDHK